MDNEQLDLARVRDHLSQVTGKQYWRSLEELVERDDFRELLDRQFPREAAALASAVDRRTFLKLMGAALVMAGVSGCAPVTPRERIVPYVREPEGVLQGVPRFYATAMPFRGSAIGLLVRSNEGRPTKVEGNPDHPASLGATDIFSQAAILELYDPDRSRNVTRQGSITTWDALVREVEVGLAGQQANGGAGLRILTEPVISPTLASQLQALLDQFPGARWHQYEPVGRANAAVGATLAFGEEVNTVYRFDEADVILALDADFLSALPGHVRYARDFADGRRVRQGQAAMSRLYAVESTPSIVGAMAEHRLSLRAGQIETFTRALARAVGVEVEGAAELSPEITRWLNAVASDLQQSQGASIVLVGDEQPPAVHALVHAINDALGNSGSTVIYTEPLVATPENPGESLRALVRDMEAGQVSMLVILGGNPVFTAPADIPFAQHLARLPVSVHLSLYQDETSSLCRWHVPQQHFLESWSDARTFDGSASIVQPLVAPLYEDRRSAHELVALLAGDRERSGYEIVRDYWQDQNGEADFEGFWRQALHTGIIEGAGLPEVSPALAPGLAGQLGPMAAPAITGGLEIIFRPDPTIWDGRFANNGWLQELPKPLTKLTWDNAALISPATAERLGVMTEDLVELQYRGRSVSAPIYVMPGHADESVTVHLGYGRTHAGQVGTGTGFNAYAIRASDRPWFSDGLVIRRRGERYRLATTQLHHQMEGRPIVRAGTLEQFRQEPAFAQVAGGGPLLPSLYPEPEISRYAWGMSIDLTACTGCNACVIACQAENNIPVVGKGEVERGREMHWIRLDRYYEGEPGNPQTYFQPVLCMHCDKAPCEWVCPTMATVQSVEGLNEQVYDRCVGTRYCSNNCPYKVRRFNFYQYVDGNIPILNEMRNPDVSVRPRGVIEKCTFCVQRINHGRIRAKQENRLIEDGEVIPACAAACPSRAIVFGDIADPESEVAALKAQPHDYGLLEELNTRPRVSYLARLRNPNPEIEAG